MKQKKTVKYYPFVSIICVTYNRRPFFSAFFQCIRNQDYPASRYEVIILDDGTDKIRDLVDKSNIPQIKYFELPEKMKLGKKRNFSHTLIDKRSKYITYFDDDDYHHPCRISHAVSMLESNPSVLCAGSSVLYIYFKHVSKMYKFGPYGPNHATAGTFTFRRELLDITKYDDDACLAEEPCFLKNFTIPFLQLDPLKTILLISHEHNTVDKRKMLINANVNFVKETDITVDSFIYRKNETSIKHFFMFEIDEILKHYQPGQSSYKPDVLKEIQDIENKRNLLSLSNIFIDAPGEERRNLSNVEVVDLISHQNEKILYLTKHVKELEEKCQILTNLLNQHINV